MRRRLLLLTLLALLALPGRAAAQQAGPAEGLPLSGIQSISTGIDHTCALLTSGQVYCWGGGSYGKLGNDDPNNHSSPTPALVVDVDGIGPLTGVTQITAGSNHTCALLTDHEVRCWGFNDSGQLATNTGYSSFRVPQIALNVAGSGPLTGVLAIDAGGDTTCAVLTSHQLRCWGYNGYGNVGGGSPANAQLPRPVSNPEGTGRLTGVAQVSVGSSTVCARLQNGQARCWGYNIAGQVGDGTRTNRSRPRVVKAVAGPGPLTGVTQISTGESLSCARLQSGQVRCWGRNVEGGLGIGHGPARSTRPVAVQSSPTGGPLRSVTEVQVGTFGACARLTNARARCWGIGDYGQMGNGDLDLNNYFPDAVVNVSGTGRLQGVQQLSHAHRHVCARMNDGTARCWGYGLSGNLGDGDTVDAPLPVIVSA